MLMGRKVDCYGNAPMESFWGSHYNELVHYHRFASRAKVRQATTEHIDIFRNRQRTQARPGYLSPAAFTARVYAR